MLVPCQECDFEISQSARRCPTCGATWPQESARKRGTIQILETLILGVVLFYLVRYLWLLLEA